MNYAKKKSRKSIRTIIISWFLLLSILPLLFVAYYSTVKYEQAIDKELSQRLSVNAREVEVIIADFKSGLQLKREKYLRDLNLIYSLSVSDFEALRNLSEQILNQDSTSEINFYNREGRLVSRVYKNEKRSVIKELPKDEAVFLSEKFLAYLKSNKEIGSLDYFESKIGLGLISRIQNQNQVNLGYIQQVIYFDRSFLLMLKAKLKLEFFLAKEDTKVIATSFADRGFQFSEVIKSSILENKEQIFEIEIKNNPYGFYVNRVEWGNNRFLLGLGVSKSDASDVLKNIRWAFFSVVGLVMIFLLITVTITSNWILKPLYELVEALQSFESQEQAITIPVKNNTEIGLLTESFNQMSIKIWQAKTDLKNKVKELEDANKKLIETQKKLVHSAKMISLGELVAGVAHELNNPISFIYSNMTHLRDYSDKLIALVRVAENQPMELQSKKEEFEFEFIVKDLPKLITSCEDGARRTRDIVLGLRNFSRLDEAQLKEADIRDLLDKSLNLVQGETKNKVEIIKNYEDIPLLKCYASQISQVFLNLISNAIQAIDNQGKIWISVRSYWHESKEFIQVSIQDTGKGIKNENLDKIFDPFFTTKEIGKGTGLGLSITYGIIQKHGGEIQVKSKENIGTEFIVTIPVDFDFTKINKNDGNY